MSSNTLFDTYEDEWRTLTDDLYSAIAKIPALAAAERERQVKSVKEKLQDAEDAVDGMSIACRGVENGSALLARLKVSFWVCVRVCARVDMVWLRALHRTIAPSWRTSRSNFKSLSFL